MKSWRKAIVGAQATVGEAIAAIESGSIQVALVLDRDGWRYPAGLAARNPSLGPCNRCDESQAGVRTGRFVA
jgi:hypothetical protein